MTIPKRCSQAYKLLVAMNNAAPMTIEDIFALPLFVDKNRAIVRRIVTNMAADLVIVNFNDAYSLSHTTRNYFYGIEKHTTDEVLTPPRTPPVWAEMPVIKRDPRLRQVSYEASGCATEPRINGWTK